MVVINSQEGVRGQIRSSKIGPRDWVPKRASPTKCPDPGQLHVPAHAFVPWTEHQLTILSASGKKGSDVTCIAIVEATRKEGSLEVGQGMGRTDHPEKMAGEREGRRLVAMRQQSQSTRKTIW